MHDPARCPRYFRFVRVCTQVGWHSRNTINNSRSRREAFCWMYTRKRIERKRADSGATSGSAFFFYADTDGKSKPAISFSCRVRLRGGTHSSLVKRFAHESHGCWHGIPVPGPHSIAIGNSGFRPFSIKTRLPSVNAYFSLQLINELGYRIYSTLPGIFTRRWAQAKYQILFCSVLWLSETGYRAILLGERLIDIWNTYVYNFYNEWKKLWRVISQRFAKRLTREFNLADVRVVIYYYRLDWRKVILPKYPEKREIQIWFSILQRELS